MISKITNPKKNKIRLILLLLLICFSNCKDEPIDGTFTDSDNDGIYNVIDNCPYISNPGQADINSDGIGDLCSDIDGVGLLDMAFLRHQRDKRKSCECYKVFQLPWLCVARVLCYDASNLGCDGKGR